MLDRKGILGFITIGILKLNAMPIDTMIVLIIVPAVRAVGNVMSYVGGTTNVNKLKKTPAELLMMLTLEYPFQSKYDPANINVIPENPRKMYKLKKTFMEPLRLNS